MKRGVAWAVIGLFVAGFLTLFVATAGLAGTIFAVSAVGAGILLAWAITVVA